MVEIEDVIAAPITGAARTPVALIRVSGVGSARLAKKLCPGAGSQTRYMYFSEIVSEGRVLDEGFLTLFEQGRSYTGEESFELSCHGSPEIVAQVMNALLALGARWARPGEFTERAFLNGRIDLTQAEAVRETVDAVTEAQTRRASLLRQGHLARKVEALSEEIGRVLAAVEASTDFPDEVGELDRPRSVAELEQAIAKIDALIASADSARILRHGLRVAIVGRPNVGKSSLLNTLLGMERAIVTEVPGTTRDTIEEALSIAGYPVVLIDTAGIRDTEDIVETIGVSRSKSAISQADEVWLVYESNVGWTETDELLRLSLERTPSLFVGNKSDLGISPTLPPQLAQNVSVSALTSDVQQITQHVQEIFAKSSEIPLVNERHVVDLVEANTALLNAVDTLQSEMPTDLASVDLQAALHSLGRITGWSAPDEVIERVFRDFCIGK